MTGTETEIKAGSFGNIKDLLRKANGTDTDSAASWRNRLKGRVGGDSPPTEQTTDQPITDEKPEKENKEQAAQTEQSTRPTQTQNAAASSPSKNQKSNEGNQGKAEEAKRITGKTSNKSKNSYKDFEKQVDSFDKQEYAGKRHMVFIADAIYNTLQVIYGDKRISAVFNSLAQNHINAYKEEMRNSFKSRSVLFQND